MKRELQITEILRDGWSSDLFTLRLRCMIGQCYCGHLFIGAPFLFFCSSKCYRKFLEDFEFFLTRWSSESFKIDKTGVIRSGRYLEFSPHNYLRVLGVTPAWLVIPV